MVGIHTTPAPDALSPTIKSEVMNYILVASTLIYLYSIWCTWSLHKAVLIGGKAAADAGYNINKVTRPLCLYRLVC